MIFIVNIGSFFDHALHIQSNEMTSRDYYKECGDDIVETVKDVVRSINTRGEVEKMSVTAVQMGESFNGKCPPLRICVSYSPPIDLSLIRSVTESLDATPAELTTSIDTAMITFDIKGSFIEKKANEYMQEDRRSKSDKPYSRTIKSGTSDWTKHLSAVLIIVVAILLLGNETSSEGIRVIFRIILFAIDYIRRCILEFSRMLILAGVTSIQALLSPDTPPPGEHQPTPSGGYTEDYVSQTQAHPKVTVTKTKPKTTNKARV